MAMDETTREKFWDTACTSRLLGFDIIVIDIVILLLLTFSFVFVKPDTATFVISVLTLAIVLVNLGAMSVVFVVCQRRKKEL